MDRFASLREHLEGKDPGGNCGGPDHDAHGIGGAQGASITLQSVRAYKQRSNKLRAYAWQHVTSELIRQEIDRECDLLTTAQAMAVEAGTAVVFPPGWDVGVGVNADINIGTSVGQLAVKVLERHGHLPTDGMLIFGRGTWRSISLRMVELNAESMIQLRSLIDTVNAQHHWSR